MAALSPTNILGKVQNNGAEELIGLGSVFPTCEDQFLSNVHGCIIIVVRSPTMLRRWDTPAPLVRDLLL